VLANRRRPAQWLWPAALLVAATACSGTEPGSPPPDDGPAGFVDVAAEVGIDFEHGAFHWGTAPDVGAMMGSGLCWLDFDGDGWLDLFVVNSYSQVEVGRWNEAGGLPTTALFHNREGVFENVTEAAGAGLAIRGTGCVAGDFDKDGAVDLYVTSERINALLWNRGDGRFEEGALDAGVASSGWHTGAAAGDLNGDGWPDLVVAGYADTNYTNPDSTEGFPDTFLPVRDLMFLSEGAADDGSVTFREIGSAVGLEARTEHGRYEYGLGVMVLDVDDDQDLDVYIANDTNPNRLYKNVQWPGGTAADPLGLGFRFEDIAGAAGVDDDRAGMGIASGDYDRNGRSDFFVTNSRDQGHGVFRDVSTPGFVPVFEEDSGRFGESDAYTGWGVSWLDFDLDADLDLVLANGAIPITDLGEDARPLQALENTGDRFTAAGEALGLAAIGPRNGRGTAAADFDNDGDVDVAVNTVGGALVLLENRGHRGNWLAVELDGFEPGASVAVELADGRRMVRNVVAGSSYLSTEDPRAHFGLGDATEIERVVVRWPGGGESEVEDVPINTRLSVATP
jgi:hypothetical protein